VNRSWQTYVANLCHDAWGLSALRSTKVIEEIEVLITTDQLSDLSVASVLSSVGMADPILGEAARSIRATIGDTRRPARQASAPYAHGQGSQLHPR
jgi:hypothetical protein